jgi:hypothetical protein
VGDGAGICFKLEEEMALAEALLATAVLGGGG